MAGMTNTLTSPTSASTQSPLAGRVAVVTGASSGIGRAIARQLADAGAQVAGLARRADRLAELGPGVTPVTVDVADPHAVAAALGRVVDEVGAPDLVVANAGIGLPNQPGEVLLEGWLRTIEVNVGGVIATLAATVPHLKAAAADGRAADFVVMSSVGDTISVPGYAGYTASKAAVTKLVRDVHLELSPLGIRTLNVRPGLVATEIQDGITDAAMRDEYTAWIQSLRALTPDDVAGPVVAALSLPRHVNVSELTIVPTEQVGAF